MLRFLRWVLKHPVSVLISILVIILFGLVSLSQIPLEIRPEQAGQGIQIIANWKRHPPETVQRMLTQPLEDVAIRLIGVSEVESSTGVGTAIIQLKFPRNTDLKYVYVDLRERLASIRDNLPLDAVLRLEPIFMDKDVGKAFSEPFFELELIGPFALNELRRLAKEKVLPRLNTVDGVGKTELFGGSDGFVQILIDHIKLKTLDISPGKIYSQLESWSVNKGVGSIKDRGQNYQLIFDVRPDDLGELNQIPIQNGKTLGDISAISFAYEAPVTLSRHNFNPLILIRLFKTPGINALGFSRNVVNKVDLIRKELPRGVSLRIATDSSAELKAELSSLGVRTAIIFSFVFAILYFLFRRFTHSVLILFVVFLSLTSAAIFLYLTGYTINVVTLAGVALVFGMLVDNAIVVLENIQQYRSKGRSDFGSGMRGTLEVFQPLLASTATTVFVFFSLLMLEDRLGSYYKPLALVLGFSLVMSLIMAVTLIPAISIRWPRFLTKKKGTHSETKALQKYASLLRFLIGHRKSAIMLVTLAFGVTGGIFWKNIDKGGFFSWGSKEILSVYVNAPKGVTLEVLDDITRGFERIIKNQNVECSTQTIVDETRGYGYIKVSFPDSILKSIVPYVMKESLISEAVNFAGVGVGIYGFGMPYWNGGYKVRTFYNTTLQITGPDYYRLWEIGESVLNLAKMDSRVNEGIISPSIRSLYQTDLKEYIFSAKIPKIWQNRTSISSFFTGAQKVFTNHSWAGDVILNEKRYPLQISYRETVPTLEALKKDYIHLEGGRSIPISEYFSVQKNPIQPWIDKKNQQYRFTVAWQYRGPERMRSQHEKSIVQSLALPPGYALEKKNWGFLTKKEERSLLKLLGIISLGTFMILAALYESFSKPLIIFFTVPFALTGVFLSYIIFNRDFNVNGYIGLIILLGIVLNNGIVLVERINQLRRKGLDLIGSAVRGGVERIRPIMITTLTTVGGLLPLLFLPSGDTAMAGILAELSFITIGGLLGSTLLSMTLIPAVYVWICGTGINN